MAVKGWPDSYGANMFLYPISLMNNPHIYLEHTHRLFGSLVGLTTLVLMIWVLAKEPREWVDLGRSPSSCWSSCRACWAGLASIT